MKEKQSQIGDQEWWVTREGLSAEVIFEQRCEWIEEMSLMILWEKNIPDRIFMVVLSPDMIWWFSHHLTGTQRDDDV